MRKEVSLVRRGAEAADRHWLVAAFTVLLIGCGESRAPEGTEVGLFSKKVALETQLSTLAGIGLEIAEGVSVADLTTFETRAELEAKPYQGLVEVMGIDVEREPFSPICERLWMCDYERVEDHGAYQEILVRLEIMTGGQLALTNVTDYVDVEERTAWVEFEYGGRRIRWDFEVVDDWLDPSVFVRYDQLLEQAGARRRIHSNHADYGQSAFLAALTAAEKAGLGKLSKIELAPLAEAR